jgi:hypothetical protein
VIILVTRGLDIDGERVIYGHRERKCFGIVLDDEDGPLRDVLTLRDSMKVDKRESVDHCST